eukprot:4063199-Alexandrium_andersonii.AAC.1
MSRPIPGAAQFKRRAPQASSHVLGSGCSTALGTPTGHRNASTTRLPGFTQRTAHLRLKQPRP